MFKHKRFILSVVAALVLFIAPSVPALAASKAKASGSNSSVTQSFGTDSTLQKGMIVALDSKDSSKVSSLTYNANKDMYGVVVAANDAALTLTSSLKDRQVYVATFGKYDVLVSNQNGPIKAGDWVTISNIDGVGMKTDDSVDTVLGKALAGFDGSSNVQGTSTLSTSDGKQTKVSLGTIQVQVAVQSNPYKSAGVPGVVTVFLTKVGASVANKSVSPARVYLALLVLIIASIVAGILLFAAVRNGLIAIGRNPLAKRDIIRGMLQVVITSLIIFILGVFAVYLLLKL
jgi:hypothetical protein